VPVTDRDDIQPGRRRPSRELDPAFVKRLEDDSLWRGDRQTRPARSPRPAKERRSRLLAIIVLVLVVLAIVFTGVGVGSGSSGSSGGGDSSQFKILPLPGDSSPGTTEPGS